MPRLFPIRPGDPRGHLSGQTPGVDRRGQPTSGRPEGIGIRDKGAFRDVSFVPAAEQTLAGTQNDVIEIVGAYLALLDSGN